MLMEWNQLIKNIIIVTNLITTIPLQIQFTNVE